ncbi:unnamed protein product [Didymodactylos carnosus]|uniref:Uncharacterized protein n=1 Tax=Didymodactylos carnosus TaxID=1234261 RepID=A0A815BEB0_9BILA|nr:unnamed protein product [Didymodactylos carnosus]CAF1367897.1 unnamed protein product [Didymodactylos carnosus]CAF4056099.1 unnamed protein product [Didymodactylos carnosus]CAF4177229.1 unnamed protein product [Didymodactylos carnosus]
MFLEDVINEEEISKLVAYINERVEIMIDVDVKTSYGKTIVNKQNYVIILNSFLFTNNILNDYQRNFLGCAVLFYYMTRTMRQLNDDMIKIKHISLDPGARRCSYAQLNEYTIPIHKFFYYKTYTTGGPCFDSGNGFQHLFYNGEVHFYEGIDGNDSDVIITNGARRTKWLNDMILKEFFTTYDLNQIKSCVNTKEPWHILEKGGSRGLCTVILESSNETYLYKYSVNVRPKWYYSNEVIYHTDWDWPLLNGISTIFYIESDDKYFIENKHLFQKVK